MLETVYHAYVETSDPAARRHLAAALRRLTYLETQRDLPKGYGKSIRLTSEEIELGRSQGKIPCIKAHRARTNYGLKESKDIVEAEFARLGYSFGQPPYRPF